MRASIACLALLVIHGCSSGGTPTGSGTETDPTLTSGGPGSSGPGTSGTSGTTTTTTTTPTTGPGTSVGPGSTTDPATDMGPIEPPGDLPIGHCGALKGTYFAADTWIYEDISSAPVRPNSAATTAWLEANGGWGNNDVFQIDTSFVILDADANTPRVTRTPDDPVTYSTDCDPGVQFPLPPGGRIEGLPDYICPGRVQGDYQGDCHLLVVEHDARVLYEAYRATYADGKYYTECDVAWDLSLDVWGEPPPPGAELPPVEGRQWGIGRDCTGPDAAGFPIAPLLFTVGDVTSGKVQHAIRFILPNNRMQRAPTEGEPGPSYVWPATHAGGPQAYSPDAPIYGSRWRLRADFDPASRGLDPQNPVVQAVVWGLQHHGMLLADGGNIALTAENADDCGTTWEDLWGPDGPRVLDGIRPSDFEVIDVGGRENGYDCVRNPARGP